MAKRNRDQALAAPRQQPAPSKPKPMPEPVTRDRPRHHISPAVPATPKRGRR